MIIRSMRATALSALAFTYMFIGPSLAGTTLNYNSAFDKLDGNSTHTLEAPPAYSCTESDWFEVGYMYDSNDGTPDGWVYLCSQFEAIRVAAGIQPYLTNPSLSRFAYDDSFPNPNEYNNYLTTTVNYNFADPVPGNWNADADHFFTRRNYFCTASYSWQGYPLGFVAVPNYTDCVLDSTDFEVFIENTEDGAIVVL